MNSDTIMSLVYAIRSLRDEVKILRLTIEENSQIQQEILELLKKMERKIEK